MMRAFDHLRSAERGASLRRAAPFVAGLIGAFGVLRFHGGGVRPVDALVALAVAVVVVAGLTAVPWGDLRRGAQLLVPLAALVVVALLRDSDGGAHSAFTPLILLPMLWATVNAEDREVVITFLAVAATLVVPMLAVGPPSYPASEATTVAAWIGVVGITALAARSVQRRSRSWEAASCRDQLTDLVNRRGWERSLPAELARARRSDRGLCVAVLDLDRFKAVNDTLGHQEGDRLLQAVAHTWKRQLRDTDVLARWGGDEFVAVFPGCTLQQAVWLCQRLRDALPDGHTASAGVAHSDGYETSAELVARADGALRQAKTHGRDRIATASSEGDARAPLSGARKTPTTA